MATFTAGADQVTGDLVTAADLNNYDGAGGSIDYLKARLNWKATSSEVLALTNQTTDTAWTDLDLTATTSSVAEWVVLELLIHIDSVSGGSCILSVRKNGDTPTHYPKTRVTDTDGDSAGTYKEAIVICGMDSGQVIEYDVNVSGTIQVDVNIRVLGYIE